MWNATMKTTVLAMALIGLGTGCDLEAAIQGLTNGPSEPTEAEAQTEPGELDEEALLECDNALEACLDAVYSNADGDDALIDDEIACFETYEECVGDHWDWWTDEEPDVIEIGEDDLLECDNELEACLGAAYAGYADGVSELVIHEAEMACFETYEECVGDHWDWWTDEEPDVIEIDEDDLFECDNELEVCLDNLYASGDEVFIDDEIACFEAHEECIGDQDWWYDDDVEACEIEVEECLESLYTDPSLTGDDLLFGEIECFERFEECIGDSPDDVWPDEPYHDGICEELVDLCFLSGVEPELCEEVYIDCIEQNGEECEVEGDEHFEDGTEEE